MARYTSKCRPRNWLIALAVALLIAGPQAAHADEIASQVAPTSWYGWQPLLSDAGAVGLWSLAALFDDAKYTSGARRADQIASTATLILGFTAYGLGSPAIHLAHGQLDNVWKSLGLRLGLPVTGAMLGAAVGFAACSPSDQEVPCPFVGGILGGVAGGVAAITIDSAFIAHEPAQRSTFAHLQPAFVPTAGGGSFVLAGSF
jgi:hypothetical protein